MIICSCSRVTDHDIHQAIAWMRASDPYALVTPGKIYRALGKTPQCGGCIRLFVDTMRSDENLAVPAAVQGLRQPAAARAAARAAEPEPARAAGLRRPA